MMKKILFLVLTLISTSAIAQTPFTVNGINYVRSVNSTGGSYAKVDISYVGGDVNIPSTVTYQNETLPVTEILNDAFAYSNGLTSVTIPDTVTKIGNRAFLECRDLTSVTIGNSVTSIGHSAFHSCSFLTSVTIPDSVTSIGEYAFYFCSRITSLTIGNSVTSIGQSTFYLCGRLTSVTIPNSVTSIGNRAFDSCFGLTSLTIPSTVTSIGNSAFADCSGLTSVKVSWATPLNINLTSAFTRRYNPIPTLIVPPGTVAAYDAAPEWTNFPNIIENCSTITYNETIVTANNSYTWNGTTYTTSGLYVGATNNCVTERLNLTINGAALDFDGDNDYATIASNNNFNVNQFTIETWLKWDSSSAEVVPFITSKGFENMEIHINKTTKSIRFIPTGGVFIDTDANSLPENTWVHVACVYNPNASLAKIYIDGIEMNTTNAGANPLSSPVVNNAVPLYLGSRGVAVFPFKGAFNEFRIWNRALTQAEIQGRMNCEIPTTACGLITNLHFNQGVAGASNTAITALTDSSGFSNNATLVNFDLTGSTSNFIATGGVVSNTSCTNISVAAPTANATQTFCGNATIASLTATGTNLLWYANAIGGTALATSVTLTNNTTYYASQTTNGCESARTAINVAINTRPPAPSAPELQILCSGSTIADLAVTGSNLLWYANNSGGSPISTSTTLANAFNYFVTQTINGCESESRTWINVALNTTPAPTAPELQILCSGSTIADLTVTGSNLRWYNSFSGGSPISTSTTLANAFNYFVTQMVNGCESARTWINVAIYTRPTAPTATAQQTICVSGTVANLTATGTDIKWYLVATGGTALASTETLTTATYYVSQTVDGCESLRAAVGVSINPIPAAPIANPNQAVCDNGTVRDDLMATGINIKWYATATGGTALAPLASLTNNATYYASQTINGCESANRTAVTVTTNTILNVPTAPATQTFCGAATVANLIATGTNLQWFDTETGPIELTTSTILTNNTIYYVSQTFADGCQTFRTAITVILNTTVAPIANATQTFCGEKTIESLIATGTSLKWYANATGGTALAPSTVLINNTTYYLSQTINGCESSRTNVTVYVYEIPTTPITNSPQNYTAGSTLASLTATGQNIQWFANFESFTALPLSTVITQSSYYVSQTINGCESERIEVLVTALLSTNESVFNSNLKVFPNPFTNEISIQIDSKASIEIVDVLGKKLIHKNIEIGLNDLDTSSLPSGMYLARITNQENQTKTIKIIKK